MILLDYETEAAQIAELCWREGMQIKEKRSPSVWASEVRRIAAGQSPLTRGHDISYDHAIMPHAVEPMDAVDEPEVNTVVLWMGRRMAKALALDTPIPTPGGWKLMGELTVGDVVFDETGKQCRVVIAKEVMIDRPCMEVLFDDRTSIVADENHDWFTLRSHKRFIRGGVRTTKEIAATIKSCRGNSHAIPVAAPLELNQIALSISPYVLGLWLGDGDHATARISSSRTDAPEIMRLIEGEGHRTVCRLYKDRCADIKIDDRVPGKRYNAFIQPIRELGLLKNEHIPRCLLRASFNQRLALMQGLMDSDGTIAADGMNASFTSARPVLAAGVMELARTLGLKPKFTKRITHCQTGVACASAKISFFPSLPVFRLSRKLRRMRLGKAKSYRERRIIRVTQVKSVPVRCIGVDSVSHLFLAGDGMVPTHNTEGICGNVIGRTVTDDPGNILDVWPVEDSSDRYSRDVIEPMISATPELDAIFVEKKSRDSGRTIDYKRFIGGSIYIINAGSKSKTRGMAVKVLLAHEVDAYPISSQGEGDPIAKALGRTEGFGDAIKIIESTGTFSADQDPLTGKKIYRSNIEMWFDRSDQRKWFCPCRSCGERYWLKWEQIKPLTKKSGELFYYLCEQCDADHNEAQWRKMVADGVWQPTAPFINGIRGYWINGFNSLLPRGKGYKSKLHQFKVEGEQALNGKPEEKQVWINEVKTELVSTTESEDPPPYQAILDGREDYATITEAGVETILVPKGGLVITAMTDLHSNRLEIEWRAWGKNEESWGLGHYVLFGDTNRQEVWEEWTQHLQKKFPHALGGIAALDLAFIDGGWNVDPIIATLLRLRIKNVPGVSGKILISKGVPEWTSVIFRQWGGIKDKAKGVHIGTWRAKSIIYERLRWHSAKEKPSDGFIHFGKNYSEEYIRQVVSEKATMQIIKGKEVETFKNPENNRNEALDLLVGNLAAFRRRRWDFDALEKQLTVKPEEAKKAEVTPKAASVANRGGLGRGWDV